MEDEGARFDDSARRFVSRFEHGSRGNDPPAARAPASARSVLRQLHPYLIGMAALPVVAALYWGKGVLMPIALASLFTFLLSPVVGALERTGLGRIRAGRVIAVLLVVGLVFSVLGGTAWIIAQQVMALGSELPQYRGNITRKIADLRGRGGGLEKVRSTAKEVMGELQKEPPPKGETKPLPVVVKSEPAGIWQLPRILEALGSAGFVIVLVIFMLFERHEIRNRLIRLLGNGRLDKVTRGLDEAGKRITRYLIMQTMVNVTYGAAIGIGLFFIGVPYAVLWGVLAFVLRFIPYVGLPIAAVGPIALSLAVFNGWQRPLVTIAIFFAVELLTYMVIEPFLYGQTAGVSQVALLVAIAFWTWLWGPTGLVLGTPLTVCLVVLGKHVPSLGFITILMGDEPALPGDVSYYQRLLAKDPTEGREIVDAYLTDHTLEQACDDVLLPALGRAKRDRDVERLSDEEARAIYRATRETIEGIAARRRSPASGTDEGSRGAVPESVPCVLACAATDEADEAALMMLGHALNAGECAIELSSAHALSAEIVSLAAEKKPAVLFIAALAPDGLAQTRHLCKRIRERLPAMKILVGRWGETDPSESDRERLLAAGADAVGTTLRQSRDQLLERLRLS
jgi:predicted PurR-regulated permease PerM